MQRLQRCNIYSGEQPDHAQSTAKRTWYQHRTCASCVHSCLIHRRCFSTYTILDDICCQERQSITRGRGNMCLMFGSRPKIGATSINQPCNCTAPGWKAAEAMTSGSSNAIVNTNGNSIMVDNSLVCNSNCMLHHTHQSSSHGSHAAPRECMMCAPTAAHITALKTTKSDCQLLLTWFPLPLLMLDSRENNVAFASQYSIIRPAA